MTLPALERTPTASRYDVVIVGGAIVGSAIAWFLSRRSDFDGRILVVERDPTYAKAASSLSASCIRHQFSNALNVEMSMFATGFIRRFREELGGDPEVPQIALHEFGYLYLASEHGAQVLAQNVAVQQACGAATRLLGSDELSTTFPFLNTDGIAVASFNPVGEGYFDGASMMHAWRRQARLAGVEYVTNEVVAISREAGRVTGVTLGDGTTVACGTVVSAAGTRAATVARMVGTDLPIEPRKRSTFVFETERPLGQVLPLVIDPSGVYARSEGNRFIGAGVPVDDRAVDPDDFEVDYTQFEEILWPALAHRIPAFEAIRFVGAWAGHYDYNVLDQNAVLGPHPEVDGFLFANGFSGHGLQHSAAVGRGIAELIATGRYQTLDLRPLGFERIAAGRPYRERNII